MTTVIIPFPPGGGGNHLKNIIVGDLDKLTYVGPTVHQHPGSNLQANQVEAALASPQNMHILHGHFGEIMSYQNQIRNIQDKKFIIICNDNAIDHQLLQQRQQRLGNATLKTGDYFQNEQVFLYEPFMYHYYFDVPMENIMNIPIAEWFVEDISKVVDKINYFLQSNLDVSAVNKLHKTWYRENFK